VIAARYIFRLDDITPTSDWDRCTALLNLLRRFKVKPLLGVVPDNHDPKLMTRAPVPHFWAQLRTLAERNLAEFAQHGFQHLLQERVNPARNGRIERSEFAGLSYHEQREKISLGRAILQHHGIDTTVWMAPNHSFDHTTLRALKDSGFTALTDGASLFPFKEEGLICIPQQLWRPRWMPTGAITICLHPDEMTVWEVARIRRFLTLRPRVTSFSEEVKRYRDRRIPEILVDTCFQTLYRSVRYLRATRSPGSLRTPPQPRPSSST